ncbi:MAG TPA: hypothetical protein VFN56_03070 [Candidatus Saccharimonadales bacterium]|nr:hypothetical protein [Candidatus Saccharimonadales bacterium]
MAQGDTSATDPQTPWQYNPGDTVAPGQQVPSPVAQAQEQQAALPLQAPVQPLTTAIPPTGPDGSIQWIASEYVAHHKSPGWYLGLAGAAILAAAIVFLLTRDKISSAVVLIGAAVFGAYGARKPRQLDYRLDERGVTIGQRSFMYEEFRSFSLIPEGAFQSIVFVPMKRFMPLTTIYFDPADQDKITALLSQRLPYEERQKDLIDRLMWRIRF